MIFYALTIAQGTFYPHNAFACHESSLLEAPSSAVKLVTRRLADGKQGIREITTAGPYSYTSSPFRVSSVAAKEIAFMPIKSDVSSGLC
jgi:hypothetical protein